MTEPGLADRFARIVARVRQPGRLIGGEFGSGKGFSADRAPLRVVLGFPDTYEIGISNQALQILYHLARAEPSVEVERTYLPWQDVISEMREAGVPLLTLETWTPVGTADLVGLTLQQELHFTNVLEMLDLAGIPLLATDRDEGDPLVVGGGPACANFLPLARFLDAVAVGDGEELWPEILRELVRAKQEGASRAERKSALSRLEGVYVPGLSRKVRRRVLRRLEGAPYPADCLVPLVAGVHDRAWVEVMRGCTRGCRFCQAGMWYRPVRERSPGAVLAAAREQVALTGHDELALGSLSTTDYSCLEEVLAEAGRSLPETRLSLPSLRVDTAAVRLARLASPTGGSLTLAPEAGSQRMRDIINKNVSEEEILAAAREAFRAGRTTLKLYFMVGLPEEQDEDVLAIADVCARILAEGRKLMGEGAGRLRLNVSVNYFVPKPFTPFQWKGMAKRAVLRHRRELLFSRLRRRGIRLAMPDLEMSYLEAALARGGEELGAVIEAAWRGGARFDAWTDRFRSEVWRKAFAAAGLSLEELATRDLGRQDPLPWGVIEGVADEEFLWREWEAAVRGLTTGDCRWSGCEDCGACPDPPGNDLCDSREGPTDYLRQGVREPRAVDAPVQPSPDMHVQPSPSETKERLRYLAGFAVEGRGRFIGHLDRAEIFRRAVRRAGGRLALSRGVRPKPRLSLALPLPVGVEATGEWCEFELAEAPPPDFELRLARALPPVVRLTSLTPRPQGRPVASLVDCAAYEVVVEAVALKAVRGRLEEGAAQPAPRQAGETGATRPAPRGVAWGAAALPESPGGGRTSTAASLEEAARRFRAAVAVAVEEERDGKKRRVEVKRYVDEVQVQPLTGTRWRLTFRTAVTPSGMVRPEHVCRALEAMGAPPLCIVRATRTEVHLADEDRQP